MLPADKLLLERIGARLRELREAAELTQDEVGERAGFTGKYIGEIEKGVRDMPLSTFRAVVQNGVGADFEAVFGGRVPRRHEAVQHMFARDVEVTATLLADLPLRVRRPLLVLVREVRVLDAQRASGSSRAAEGRAPYSPATRRRSRGVKSPRPHADRTRRT
jgi:transcriptional regulator with XRE-family HTH domain